jgi:hypothetical protein
MTGKKKILILSYGHLKNDARIKRQVLALEDKYELFLAAFDSIDDKYAFFPLNEAKKNIRFTFHLHYPLVARKLVSMCVRFAEGIRKLNAEKYYEERYWTNEKKEDLKNIRAKGIEFDLIIANDIEPLPIALLLKSKHTKVMIDSHEYHPLEFEQDPAWMKNEHPYFHYLCKKYLPQADAMTTVSTGLVRQFKQEYNVTPVLITNATAFYDLQPVQTKPDLIRIVYHGLAIPVRHLELLIEMMKYLDKRFTLAMIFAGEKNDYLALLQEMAKDDPRISFPPPVKSAEIPFYTNTYDIGIEIVPPVNFNYKYSLGNKFFEYIQARLVNAVGPMPEMMSYLEKYHLGIAAPDFTAKSMAQIFNALTVDEIMRFKNNAHKYARELSAESNMEILIREVQKLLPN